MSKVRIHGMSTCHLKSVIEKALKAADMSAALRVIQSEYLSGEEWASVSTLAELEQWSVERGIAMDAGLELVEAMVWGQVR